MAGNACPLQVFKGEACAAVQYSASKMPWLCLGVMTYKYTTTYIIITNHAIFQQSFVFIWLGCHMAISKLILLLVITSDKIILVIYLPEATL